MSSSPASMVYGGVGHKASMNSSSSSSSSICCASSCSSNLSSLSTTTTTQSPMVNKSNLNNKPTHSTVAFELFFDSPGCGSTSSTIAVRPKPKSLQEAFNHYRNHKIVSTIFFYMSNILETAKKKNVHLNVTMH